MTVMQMPVAYSGAARFSPTAPAVLGRDIRAVADPEGTGEALPGFGKLASSQGRIVSNTSSGGSQVDTQKLNRVCVVCGRELAEDRSSAALIPAWYL